MIERRYVGVETVGRIDQVIDRIRSTVRNLSQTHLIPVIKLEKKPRGRFLVFLALEGVADDRLPATVTQLLRAAGLTGRHYWPLRLAEIKSMVSGTEIETVGFGALAYKPLWGYDPGDPYDLADDDSIECESENSEVDDRYNRLLYWCSVAAGGSWGTFVTACQVLGIARDSTHARHVFRRFTVLGHIECSSDGSRWSVAPSALVLCPTKNGLGFLCGQRTPKLLKQVSERFDISESSQPESQGPVCVEVGYGTLSPDHIELSSSNFIFAVGAVSNSLGVYLPDIEEWRESLTPIEKLNTTTCSIERWDGKQYSACPDFYQRDDLYVGESGLYRLTRGEGTSTHRMTLYFDNENQKWVKGDWYGLRFLVYKHAGIECEAVYHQLHSELMVPIIERWPMLYERSLVLASGRLPSRSADKDWLSFSGVPEQLAVLLSDKLGISLRRISH
jgi:hypothetical protein